ncbi:hypothetical protein DY000_02008194 [Brassica cretica]|uniref:Uncharacterized protein n=1 Tax=Brassica cretica TaxID=69181 RepID=A0ABQ7CH18_BRACR|nr:hypothetical protein DY000_02008194 [Brassica cretica]
MHGLMSYRCLEGSNRYTATELRFVATELWVGLGCYAATGQRVCVVVTQWSSLRPSVRSARSLRSDRALPKRRYDISPCILVYPSMLSPEDRSEPISRSPPF